MKTLTINRPEGLAMACHSYRFRHDETDTDLRELDKAKVDRALNQFVANYDGSYTNDSLVGMFAFLLRGAQLCIDEDLSRDLEASSICGDLDSLVWPATALHVVFQDPALPSIIAQKRSNIDNDASGIFVDMCFKDGSNSGVLLGNSDWRAYCEDKWSPPITQENRWCEEELSKHEHDAVRYMACLFAKALAYASIPHHAPTRLTTRAEKKQAGIHPNQQTDKPTLLLRHLPRVIKEPATGSGDHGPQHRFMGRAGHLRHYQAERYKSMKGQWQWIPPIPPPEGIKVIYKVRKVAA